MNIEEMTPAQLYRRLDWLVEHRRQHERERTAEAAYVRYFCKEERKRVKRELKCRGLPATRPDDTRCYGPACATWQRTGMNNEIQHQ